MNMNGGQDWDQVVLRKKAPSSGAEYGRRCMRGNCWFRLGWSGAAGGVLAAVFVLPCECRVLLFFCLSQCCSARASPPFTGLALLLALLLSCLVVLAVLGPEACPCPACPAAAASKPSAVNAAIRAGGQLCRCNSSWGGHVLPAATLGRGRLAGNRQQVA